MLKQSSGGKPVMFVTELAMTFLIAELSWRFIELPISKLRPLVTINRMGKDPTPLRVLQPNKN